MTFPYEDVLDTIPSEHHDSIRDFSITIGLDTYIQTASDNAKTSRKTLFFPSGLYPIDNPVWITDTPFESMNWRGENRGVIGNGGTTIHCKFKNLPAVIIQFGRGVHIADLSITGQNIGVDNITEPDSDPSSYVLNGTRDSPQSPYCGIAIDPTAAEPPADGGYPGLTYQDTSSGSADITIERVNVSDFVVGIMVRPSGTAQGDQINILDTNIRGCRASYAWGNTQARNNLVSKGTIQFMHTGFDGLSYGEFAGVPPVIRDVQVLQAYQIINLPHSRGIGLVSGVYSEQIKRIGSFGTGFSTVRFPILFQGCSFNWGRVSWEEEQFLLRGSGLFHLSGCSFENAVKFPDEINFGDLAGSSVVLRECSLKLSDAGTIAFLNGFISISNCWVYTPTESFITNNEDQAERSKRRIE